MPISFQYFKEVISSLLSEYQSGERNVGDASIFAVLYVSEGPPFQILESNIKWSGTRQGLYHQGGYNTVLDTSRESAPDFLPKHNLNLRYELFSGSHLNVHNAQM